MELTTDYVRGATRRLVHDLVTLRYQSGRTQKQVAQQMGISRSAVTHFENSRDKDPRISTVLRYAAAVGIHLSATTQENPHAVQDRRSADLIR